MKRGFKKTLAFFTAVIIFCSVFVSLSGLEPNPNGFLVKSNAADESVLIFEENADGVSYAVSGCRSVASGEVVIPSTYNGLPVTVIGDSAFHHCGKITSVKLPETLISIGNLAFTYCSSIETITIPESVTNISSTAFKICTSLSSINVASGNEVYSSVDGVLFDKNKTTILRYPEAKTNTVYSIPDGVTTVGGYAFCDALNLTTINIPEEVTQINSYAFYGCQNVTAIDIPDNITVIAPYTFYNCRSLTEFEIPDNVTSIGSSAFHYCLKLNSISIPDSVTFIGSSAFNTCQNITKIVIPDGITNIYSSTFDGCLKLTSVVIPETIESIGDSAFYECKALTSITLPSKLKNLGSYAFRFCKCLESIYIPASVTDIGTDAFFACSALTAINVDSNNAEYTSVDGVLFDKDKKYVLKFPENKVMEEYVIPEGVKALLHYSFYATSIDSIVFPSTIEEIDSEAFYMSKITTVTIPGTVMFVFDDAFRSCNDIENVLIESSNTELFYSCFNGCNNMMLYSPGYSNAYFYANENCIPNVVYKKGVNFNLKNKTVTIDSPKDRLEDVCDSDSEGVYVSMDKNSVCTGAVMSVYHYGSVHEQFTLVVSGDINGDSVCDALDCYEVERAISSNTELSGAYSMAADSNSDNNIDIADFQSVVNKSLSL